MKRYSSLVLALVIGVGAIGMAKKSGSTSPEQETKEQAQSAAFRDGKYLGKLAAERGDTAHVATARWANEADRADFASGYEQAYIASATGSPAVEADATAIAAYRDGLYLGKLDAERGQDAHVATARWSQESHRSAFTEGYNQGYQNGESARTEQATVRLAKVVR